MLLFILQIISRVLEYDTDLLFRSLVFVLCGSGLISAGLWFERRLQERATVKKQ
jgi:ethanolamine transporter EutH